MKVTMKSSLIIFFFGFVIFSTQTSSLFAEDIQIIIDKVLPRGVFTRGIADQGLRRVSKSITEYERLQNKIIVIVHIDKDTHSSTDGKSRFLIAWPEKKKNVEIDLSLATLGNYLTDIAKLEIEATREENIEAAKKAGVDYKPAGDSRIRAAKSGNMDSFLNQLSIVVQNLTNPDPNIRDGDFRMIGTSKDNWQLILRDHRFTNGGRVSCGRKTVSEWKPCYWSGLEKKQTPPPHTEFLKILETTDFDYIECHAKAKPIR